MVKTLIIQKRSKF